MIYTSLVLQVRSAERSKLLSYQAKPFYASYWLWRWQPRLLVTKELVSSKYRYILFVHVSPTMTEMVREVLFAA